MSENSADAPEQVVKFAPRGQPRSYDAPVEEAGQAVVAKSRRATELANETCDPLPDTLDPLVVDCPARPAQQRGDLAITIAAVVPGKLDNSGGERRFTCSVFSPPNS